MKVLISGSSGFVGSALVKKMRGLKHEVFRLVRKKEKLQKDEIYWNPEKSEIDLEKLEGFDAVVHLAGENILGRWTEAKKKKIRDSRVKGTQFLSESLVQLSKPPASLLCSSAIGFYGNRGEETLNESSLPGNGFLADVCQEWESASQAASKPGIRVIHYRIGLVLSAEGGALAKMLLPFKLGLGGKLGNGQQWMSWIHLEDLLAGIVFILENSSLSQAVNAVSPHPVRNQEFTECLANSLHRPAYFTVPEFALKLVTGEMAEEALLTSAKVAPHRLLQAGFKFKYPHLLEALRDLI